MRLSSPSTDKTFSLVLGRIEIETTFTRIRCLISFCVGISGINERGRVDLWSRRVSGWNFSCNRSELVEAHFSVSQVYLMDYRWHLLVSRNRSDCFLREWRRRWWTRELEPLRLLPLSAGRSRWNDCRCSFCRCLSREHLTREWRLCPSLAFNLFY